MRAGGNGDPRYVWTAISVDAVDQFQVQTIGYSAIYEGQGVMNYSVKQGGSSYHGSVYEFFRNTALDTWGFFGKIPNAVTGLPVKPIEHSNEYGIDLGGPLVPFGSLEAQALLLHQLRRLPLFQRDPDADDLPHRRRTGRRLQRRRVNIYDPTNQAACTANSTNGPCRYQYGYGPGHRHRGLRQSGDCSARSAGQRDPCSEFATVAKNMQAFLPTVSASRDHRTENNYVAPNATGLCNWSTT